MPFTGSTCGSILKLRTFNKRFIGKPIRGIRYIQVGPFICIRQMITWGEESVRCPFSLSHLMWSQNPMDVKYFRQYLQGQYRGQYSFCHTSLTLGMNLHQQGYLWTQFMRHELLNWNIMSIKFDGIQSYLYHIFELQVSVYDVKDSSNIPTLLHNML